MQLAGKVVAITGGSAGIGRAIAEAFLAQGATVALFARNADKGARALAEMGAGARGLFVAGDATVQADVERFVDATQALFGRLDVLVNYAGGAGDPKAAWQAHKDELWADVKRKQREVKRKR